MVLRLMPCSPRRRIRFCHRRPADRWWAEPGWADVTSTGLGISNGCQDHTVLPYAATSIKVLNGPCAARRVLAKALKRRSSCAPLDRSRKTALRSRHAPDAAASTASCPASVTIAIRPLVGRTAGFLGLIWGSGKEEYFPRRGLTGRLKREGATCHDRITGPLGRRLISAQPNAD